MRRPKASAALAALAVAALAPAGLALAGGEPETPPTTQPVLDPSAAGTTDFGVEDEAWAAEFNETLADLLARSGRPGEPGDLDILEDEIIQTRVASGDSLLEAIVGVIPTDDLPEGGDSALNGPCMGVAISFDGNGQVIDAAVDFDDPGAPIDIYGSGKGTQAFRSGNPFLVSWKGFVAYAGRADPAPIDHEWQIRTQGFSVDQGGDDNPQAENRNAGAVDLANDVPGPAQVNGLFNIEGEIDAAGGFHCDGNGYFRTTGGIPALLFAGSGLVLVAGWGALFNARPAQTWRA